MERKTESLYALTPCFDGYLEEALEGEIRLADYYPDAQEILKTELTVRVTAGKVLGDKIRVEGTAVFRICYASSDGSTLGSVSLSLPFSKIFEAKRTLPSDAKVDCTAVTQYKNARLVNPRKIEVKGSVGLSLRVGARTATEYLVPSDGSVEYRTEEITVGEFVGSGTREQRINEEFPLPDGKPAVGMIVRCDAYAHLTDVRAITNKAVLKGDMIVTALYLDEKGEPERLEYALPVTQIVEVEGIGEKTRLLAAFRVAEYKLEPLTGASGEANAVRLEALLLAELTGYDQKQIRVCTDAYSVSSAVELRRGDLPSEELVNVEVLERPFRETLEYSAGDVKRIYDVWGEVKDAGAERTETGWKVNGIVSLTVLAYDNEDRLCSVDSELPVSADLRVTTDENTFVESRLTLTSLSFAMTGENLIEVRGDMKVDAAVYRRTLPEVVTDIFPVEGGIQEHPTPFSVYFASAGESVWDIAKAHSAHPVDLIRDNSLAGETIQEDRILKIFS